MDFALTEDEKLFRGAVREFATAVLAPAARIADEAGRFAPELLAQTAALGLFGMLVPEAQGGAGVGAVRFALALEEVARGSAAMAAVLNTHNTLAALPLVIGGSAEQQARWLPVLARGAALGAGTLAVASGAVASGAPAPGAAAVRAMPAGGGWRLNGSARWVTNGDVAEVYVLFAAQTGNVESGVEGFVVPAGTVGVRVGAPIERVGLRGAVTADLALDGCRLPAGAVLGAASGSAGLATAVGDAALIGSAAQALGIAQASLDAALAYAQEREQFGQPIARFEGLRHMLADVALAIDAARLLVYRAAWDWEHGRPTAKAAAMAKLHAGETAILAATKAVQVHGGYGYMREAAVQRYFRDAKVTQASEGNPLQQRSAIADTVLPG